MLNLNYHRTFFIRLIFSVQLLYHVDYISVIANFIWESTQIIYKSRCCCNLVYLTSIVLSPKIHAIIGQATWSNIYKENQRGEKLSVLLKVEMKLPSFFTFLCLWCSSMDDRPIQVPILYGAYLLKCIKQRS